MRYDCGFHSPILEYTVVGKKLEMNKTRISLWKIFPNLTAHILKKFQGFFIENLRNLPGIAKKKHEAERKFTNHQ